MEQYRLFRVNMIKLVEKTNIEMRGIMGNKKIEISICDDEPIIQNAVKKLCEKYLDEHNMDYRIALFDNGTRLINYEGDINILFLDVEMPGINGFQVAKELNNKQNNIFIVFITSHSNMIKEAFKVKAFRYLYKPLDHEEFFEAIEEAIKEFTESQSIILKQREESILIEKKDILYIESLGEGSAIYVRDNSYVTQNSLKKWREELGDRHFFQCHKSFIVNFQNVIKIENGHFLLKNNKETPVSIRNRKIAKDRFIEYISQNARYV